MKKIISPQILFKYNNRGQIIDIFFLTYLERSELEKTPIFSYYNYLRKTLSDIFITNTYTIIKDHILLTLTVEEIRGYIRHILNIKKKILIFSLWNNIDYYNVDNSVFNPFTENIYTKTKDNTLIYNIYPNITQNPIFSVLEEDESIKKNLFSEGVYKEKISEFVNDIFEQDILIDLEFLIEMDNKDVFDLKWNESLINIINNVDFVSKIINESYFNNYLISGSELILLDDSEKKDKIGKTIYCYDDDITDSNILKQNIFLIKDNILYINDTQKFQYMISEKKDLMRYLEISKIKASNKQYKINFENFTFNTGLDINFDFNNDFFIELTPKVRNIFLDRTKKISIMTANKHISFKTQFNSFNSNLFEYITKILIGLQVFNQNIIYRKVLKKTSASRYYSRYCQGFRKPVPIPDEIKDKVLDNDFENINNIFYKSFDKKNSDMYYNEEIEKLMYCEEPEHMHIGFINELYQSDNTCFPCCYKKDKTNSSIFNKCVGIEDGRIVDIPRITEPYLHVFKRYRVMMDTNKIGSIFNKIGELFNANTKMIFQTDKKNIRESSVSDLIDFSHSKSKYNLIISTNKGEKIKEKYNTTIKEKLKSYNLDDSLQYILINALNKVRLAKNYIVYMATKDHEDIKKIEDVAYYYTDTNSIFFYEDEMYYNPIILNRYFEDQNKFFKTLNFYLLIDNKIHILQSLDKHHFEEDLKISEVPFFIKEKILNKILKQETFVFKKNRGNTSLDNNIFSITDGDTKIDILNRVSQPTKYFYNFIKISLDKNTLGYYITEILYRDYFKTFLFLSPTDFIIIKKTFLNNLYNNLKLKVNFDNTLKPDNKIQNDIIMKIISILNINFIDKKELRKYQEV